MRTKHWTQGIYSRVWVQGMKSEVVLTSHHVHTKCWWSSLKKITPLRFQKQIFELWFKLESPCKVHSRGFWTQNPYMNPLSGTLSDTNYSIQCSSLEHAQGSLKISLLPFAIINLLGFIIYDNMLVPPFQTRITSRPPIM